MVREQWAPRAELPFSLRSVLGLPPSPGPALATLPQGLVLISLGNPHLGAKVILTPCVRADLLLLFFFFETLKECIPDLFNVLCFENILNSAENHTSLYLSPGFCCRSVILGIPWLEAE